MSWLAATAEGVCLSLRVVPRASKNEICGEMGGALKVRLQAPPVEGKANRALVEFLAEQLEVPRARISIEAGELGRNKRILIRGMTEGEVREKLSG